MLSDRSGPRPDEEWIDRLAPKVADLRAALRRLPPQEVAERSGAVLEDHRLLLTMLFRPYTIDARTYLARQPDGPEVSSFVQALLLTYLLTADGIPPAGRWMSFRELPHGGFYHQAFQGYTGDRLVKKWEQDLTGFEKACQSLGGSPVDMGSAGFSLEVLPRLKLAAVYWLGDDDLPSRRHHPVRHHRPSLHGCRRAGHPRQSPGWQDPRQLTPRLRTQITPRSWPILLKAAAPYSRSSSEWAAEIITRIRAVPICTVG